MEAVRRWWQELAGLVLPGECGGCGRARTVLCPQCRTALCGTGTVPFRVRPVLEPPGLPAVHAAAPYADEVRAVLLAHKERGALALARPLGAALAGAVRAGLREAGVGEGEGEGEAPQPPSGVLLVPVPSSRAAVRARGHDPARRIALAAAGELRRTGVPARVAAVLRQRRPVADQAGLDSRGRLDNLVGALAVAPGGVRVLCGAPVVLVDDLVTTGASLAEAARAVRAATGAGPDRAGPVDPVGPVDMEDPVGRECSGDPERLERRPFGRLGGAAQVGRMDGGGAGTGSVKDVGETEGGMCGGGAGAVYGGVTREGRKVKPSGAREEGTGGAPVGASGSGGQGGAGCSGRPGDVLCAAVVAASPGSFEINRN
ncbi:ComF family protein [Streptomyces rishiriensis]|uniref:ComF family protein n=1 Tax=Streptomyces rishiriensis TaxID=68264 RepID=UPI0037D723AC